MAMVERRQAAADPAEALERTLRSVGTVLKRRARAERPLEAESCGLLADEIEKALTRHQATKHRRDSA